MLFSVVETHIAGVRLSREAASAASPVVGLLTISDWREGNASFPSLLPPLFDPAIVRMTASGFLLPGSQITDNACVVQGCWVRQVSGSGHAARTEGL